MKESTEEVLARINAESERRAKLTETELREQYASMESAGYPISMQIQFAADISGSRQIPYHYELLRESWEKGKKEIGDLGTGFGKHGKEGLEYLFGKLESETSAAAKVSIQYLIARILNNAKHRDFYEPCCARLIPWLVGSAKATDAQERQKALIALGWIGSEEEVSIMSAHLLNDEDSLCRAWAAAGLMQMSFNRVDGAYICANAKDAFAKAIADEPDLYACGAMLEAAQTLYRKKWISRAAAEEAEEDKIEKTRATAGRFFKKMLAQ